MVSTEPLWKMINCAGSTGWTGAPCAAGAPAARQTPMRTNMTGRRRFIIFFSLSLTNWDGVQQRSAPLAHALDRPHLAQAVGDLLRQIEWLLGGRRQIAAGKRPRPGGPEERA